MNFIVMPSTSAAASSSPATSSADSRPISSATTKKRKSTSATISFRCRSRSYDSDELSDACSSNALNYDNSSHERMRQTLSKNVRSHFSTNSQVCSSTSNTTTTRKTPYCQTTTRSKHNVENNNKNNRRRTTVATTNNRATTTNTMRKNSTVYVLIITQLLNTVCGRPNLRDDGLAAASHLRTKTPEQGIQEINPILRHRYSSRFQERLKTLHDALSTIHSQNRQLHFAQVNTTSRSWPSNRSARIGSGAAKNGSYTNARNCFFSPIQCQLPYSAPQTHRVDSLETSSRQSGGRATNLVKGRQQQRERNYYNHNHYSSPNSWTSARDGMIAAPATTSDESDQDEGVITYQTDMGEKATDSSKDEKETLKIAQLTDESNKKTNESAPSDVYFGAEDSAIVKRHALDEPQALLFVKYPLTKRATKTRKLKSKRAHDERKVLRRWRAFMRDMSSTEKIEKLALPLIVYSAIDSV